MHRVPEAYAWKLNSTENFSRMRLKLSREYGGNRHRDASRLRDVGSVLSVPSEPTSADTALLSLVKVSTRLDSPLFNQHTLYHHDNHPLRPQSQSEEDELLEQQLASEGGHLGGIQNSEVGPLEGRETVVRREVCDLVSFMERVSGRLEITTRNIFFHANERKEGHGCEWAACCHSDCHYHCTWFCRG